MVDSERIWKILDQTLPFLNRFFTDFTNFRTVKFCGGESRTARDVCTPGLSVRSVKTLETLEIMRQKRVMEASDLTLLVDG